MFLNRSTFLACTVFCRRHFNNYLSPFFEENHKAEQFANVKILLDYNVSSLNLRENHIIWRISPVT